MSVYAHKTAKRALASVAGVALIAGMTGCNNGGEGAFTGAALGALSGLAIGSVTGSAGKGAAIGAVSGGILGGIIGDQNARNANGGYPARDTYGTSHRGGSHHERHNDPWWDDDCDW